MNPNLVGCYEAPIPSATSTIGGPTQSYSEPTSGPTLVGHTLTTASYPGPFVVTTNPPSVPTNILQYSNNGCWARNTTAGSPPIISGVYTFSNNLLMTVDLCLATCFSNYGTTYASLVEESLTG